jgi:hypothetical protein
MIASTATCQLTATYDNPGFIVAEVFWPRGESNENSMTFDRIAHLVHLASIYEHSLNFGLIGPWYLYFAGDCRAQTFSTASRHCHPPSF